MQIEKYLKFDKVCCTIIRETKVLICRDRHDVNIDYNFLLGMPGTAHSRRPWNRIDAPKWKIGRLYNHDDSNEQHYYRVIK